MGKKIRCHHKSRFACTSSSSVTPLNLVSPSIPTQVPNWAWATSRPSWTASPAGSPIWTCPMPTRRLPPTVRTHEGRTSSSFSPSPLPPPPARHPPPAASLPTPSTSTPSPGCCEEEEEGEGFGGRWGVLFAFLLSFYSPSGEGEPPPSFPQQPGPSLSPPLTPRTLAERFSLFLRTKLSVT